MNQTEVINTILSGKNVFLTGGPGTGKTHVINKIKKIIKHKEIIYTATTGIAATHIDGKTIHSWSGIGIKGEQELTSSSILERIALKKWNKKRIQNTDILIIDEISMLHPFQLQAINLISQHARHRAEMFGGIQVILCGDFFQLPPISQNENDKHYLFESETWKYLNLKICYLEKTYRHEDQKFIEILSEIRKNSISSNNKKFLFDKIDQPIEKRYNPIKLFATNADVDTINNIELAKINKPVHTFHMQKWHLDLYALNNLVKCCLAPEVLHLKEDAIVMFLRNHPDGIYVNGTIGKVIKFTYEGKPVVETSDGIRIIVQPTTWERTDYDFKSNTNEKIASITQLPLRLAWAITIHKSQGMSLDCAEMDLSKSFEDGMGYVALSRVRTLSGIKLLGLNDQALRVNNKVIEFDNTIKDF